ncbi:hypothetical protein EDB89DRAFT_2228411, partial [Lactarius sanguifluus]
MVYKMAHSIRRSPLTSNRQLAVWLTLWEGSLLQIFSLGDAVPDRQPVNVEIIIQVKKGRGDVEVSSLVTLQFMADTLTLSSRQGNNDCQIGDWVRQNCSVRLNRPFFLISLC